MSRHEGMYARAANSADLRILFRVIFFRSNADRWKRKKIVGGPQCAMSSMWIVWVFLQINFPFIFVLCQKDRQRHAEKEEEEDVKSWRKKLFFHVIVMSRVYTRCAPIAAAAVSPSLVFRKLCAHRFLFFLLLSFSFFYDSHSKCAIGLIVSQRALEMCLRLYLFT